MCGSLSHPQCARKSEKAPTGDQLKKAKKIVEKASSDANDLSNICSRLIAEANAIKELIFKQVADLGFECDLESFKAKANDDLININAEINDLDDKIKEEENRISRKNDLDKSIPVKESILLSLNIEIQDLAKDKSVYEANLNNKRKQLESEKKNVHFESKQKAHDRITELEASIKELDEEINETEKDYNESNTKIREYESAIEGLRKQVKEFEGLDKDAENNKLSDLKFKKDEAQCTLTAITNRLQKMFLDTNC